MSKNLLIKFPTRSRKEKFFNVLEKYIQMSEDLDNLGFLISLDTDDYSMNNEEVINRLKSIKKNVKLAYTFNYNKTKIQAINVDMYKTTGWDIVLLASDDMIPVVKGYDQIIRQDMSKHFSDTDGTLWYNDGGQSDINTLCILGKKYFDRFGYIYHPAYTSLWCDNEFTKVSQKLNKVYRSQTTIIEHAHPVYKKTNYDPLYAKNESFYIADKQVFLDRESKNFDL